MIPRLSNWETKAGDILITSSNLISSTLHLAELRLTVGVLLFFCTLIKALTFHDRIIVPPSGTEFFEDKRLFKYLKERKILYAVNRDACSALNNEFLGTSSARKHLKMLLSVNGIIYLIMDIVQVYIYQNFSAIEVSV